MRGRRLPAGAVLVALAVTASAGCGAGGDKSRICADATRAVTGYNARLNQISPDDIRQWRQAASVLAARFDALARQTGDRRLRTALRTLAADWHGVSTGITPRDISRLQATVRRQPELLSSACR